MTRYFITDRLTGEVRDCGLIAYLFWTWCCPPKRHVKVKTRR